MEAIVRAAGPEADETVCEHWKAMWLANAVKETAINANYVETTTSFIDHARAHLSYQTFLALDRDSNVLGSASCQEWSGPMPTGLEGHFGKLGTVWGVFVKEEYRRRGIATALMQRVKDHWESIGCHKGVLLHASEAGRRVYQDVGFHQGEMLTLDISSDVCPSQPSSHSSKGLVSIRAAGAAGDSTVVQHVAAARAEMGWRDFAIDDADSRVVTFIEEARENNAAEVFTALLEDGTIIGSVVSQRWSGPLPQILCTEVFQLGSAWGLFVDPQHRGRGIGRALMQQCVEHWRSLQCLRGVIVHPTGNNGAADFLSRLGWTAGNAMVVELSGAVRDEVHPAMLARLRSRLGEALLSDHELQLMLNALPTQLATATSLSKSIEKQRVFKAVQEVQREHGTCVITGDNWFTRNVCRFGAGFDMQQLCTDSEQLAAKFSQLSTKYDHWVLGNGSRVEEWLAQMAHQKLSTVNTSKMRAVDVACGIGLPGQTLRLCDFGGEIVGLDVSPGMVQRTLARGAYDKAFVCDANKGLLLPAAYADILICTGAMELLQHQVVLPEFHRVLKPGGQLWVSFQWAEAGQENPTKHQNICGCSVDMITRSLAAAGFEIEQLDRCECAFQTPSPKQDGTLLRVPYVFVIAQSSTPTNSPLP